MRNKITFAENNKKKRSRFLYYKEIDSMLKKYLKTFLREKREVDCKNYYFKKNCSYFSKMMQK